MFCHMRWRLPQTGTTTVFNPSPPPPPPAIFRETSKPQNRRHLFDVELYLTVHKSFVSTSLNIIHRGCTFHLSYPYWTRLLHYAKIQWAQSPWQININSDKNITQWLLLSSQTIVCCSVGCKYRYTRCNAYWNTHIFLRLWTREHVSAILCPKICFYILMSTITHFLDRSNITKLVKHYNKVSYFPLKSNCFLFCL
jgi:hypothetical protein